MGISKLLEKFNFKKSLGQNFILDTNFQKAIVADCGVSKDDEVLEIGAGAGTLTNALAEACGKVVSYEKDESLREILAESVTKNNVTIKFCDILSKSLDEIESDFCGQYTMVANLPYYITTPIIFHFLPSKKLKCLNIMVQKEVAERIVAKPNTKDYGILTLMINFYGKAKIVRNINRNMYVPSPNVDSAMVRIDMFDNVDTEVEPIYSKLVHVSFAMRRKTLRNNLSKGLDLNGEQLDTLLKGFEPNIRAESLSKDDFILLSKRFLGI